jgi:hypothetical protein
MHGQSIDGTAGLPLHHHHDLPDVRGRGILAMTETTDDPSAEATGRSVLERIAEALEDIVFALSAEGSIGEQLYLIQEALDAITPETDTGRRYLRTLDIGND